MSCYLLSVAGVSHVIPNYWSYQSSFMHCFSPSDLFYSFILAWEFAFDLLTTLSCKLKKRTDKVFFLVKDARDPNMNVSIFSHPSVAQVGWGQFRLLRLSSVWFSWGFCSSTLLPLSSEGVRPPSWRPSCPAHHCSFSIFPSEQFPQKLSCMFNPILTSTSWSTRMKALRRYLIFFPYVLLWGWCPWKCFTKYARLYKV